jgi:hypothetical protein
MIKFKDVEFAFELRKLAFCDQDYLKSMLYETVTDRSYKQSGKSFQSLFPGACNFTIFNDYNTMVNYMLEFSDDYAYMGTHLLHGRKYYLAWTYNS